MYTRDLYRKIIQEPAQRGCQDLLIVSGYVSPAFLSMIVNGGDGDAFPRVIDASRTLSVVLGMYPQVGVTMDEHRRFSNLEASTETEVLYYNPSKVAEPREVHSKVYLWLKDGRPTEAFLGSMNATSSGFFAAAREAATTCDPVQAQRYIASIQTSCVSASNVQDLITRKSSSLELVLTSGQSDLESLPFVDLPLTPFGRGISVHQDSGLNWGQRDKREPNQAYIPVPAAIQRSGFFPPRGVLFQVTTDDGEQFIAARRQDNGKAIHSVESNAIIGAWFRKRLGLPSGAFVSLEDLQRFGRLDVRFYALPSGEYLMDYRRPS